MLLKGIRKICTMTKQVCDGYYNPHYVEVFYNYKTGEVWGVEHYDLGHNSYSVYQDPYIISCGNIYTPTNMYGISEIVKRTCYERRIPVEAIQKGITNE